MFEIGDKIVYGAEGVFTVAELSASPTDKTDTRVFYILKPVFGKESHIIYTPAEGGVIRMRPVMSQEDALALLNQVANVDEVLVEKEKNRRDVYRAIIKEAYGIEYISIMKTVMNRRTLFFKQKKRLPEADVEYEKRAKHCLFGELAVAMDISYENAESLVTEKLTAGA